MNRTAFASGREPLSARVLRDLRRRILDGRQPPGSRLTELGLAEELDVSRTPVRQALQQLAREGFVVSAPGRGFTVATLSSREVRELFAVIAELETDALTWGGVPGTDQLALLADLNVRFRQADGDVDRALALNGDWHRTLVRHCPNSELRRIVEENRQRAYRYEFVYFDTDAEHVTVAAGLHRDVLVPLRLGELDAACDAVRGHWLADLDLMLPAIVEAAG